MKHSKPDRFGTTARALVVLSFVLLQSARAEIKEPDNLLYGTISLDGVPVTSARTDVVVEARHLPLLPVQLHPDGRAHRRSRYPRTAPAGSAAPQIPLRTATPWAPAALSSATRPGVTPPMARTGVARAAAQARSTSAVPPAVRSGCDEVANTVPIKR